MMNRRKFLFNGLAAAAAYAPLAMCHAGAEEQKERERWAMRRKRFEKSWLDLLGEFPHNKCPLAEEMRKVEEKGGIARYHVSFSAEEDDRVTAWLLAPDSARKKHGPAVICLHGTTYGTGKDRTVGLAGNRPYDPPDKPDSSRAYGLELARLGYFTLSIDLLGDGERAGDGLYDSRAFYRRHPDWSIIGKHVWDMMRSVDFLRTLDFVDPRRIGCLGHSLGGHAALFAAAFEPRLAASCCNCGVLAWFSKLQDKYHWARAESGTVKEGSPALAYDYIKRFAKYYKSGAPPVPVDFDSLMMLSAPRPLLIMACDAEVADYRLVEKVARASVVYREFDVGDHLMLFSFPGGHNYPPAAKRHSFNWFDRWLDHVPALPII